MCVVVFVAGSPNAHSPVLNLSKSNPDRILQQERVSTPIEDQDGSVSDQEPLEEAQNQRATPQSHSDEDLQEDNVSDADDDEDIKEQGKILFSKI